MKIKVKRDDAHVSSGGEIHHSGLEKRQRVLSVVVLVQPSSSFGLWFEIKIVILEKVHGTLMLS